MNEFLGKRVILATHFKNKKNREIDKEGRVKRKKEKEMNSENERDEDEPKIAGSF